MRRTVGVIVTLVCGLGVAVAVRAQGPTPAWAYPVTPATFKAPPDPGTQRRVPGSKLGFTQTQIDDPFTPPDWYTDHPRMPEVVARGRKPDVWACAMCHLPNGLGHPESAYLAGLQAAYIQQQVEDFKSGARKSAVASGRPAIMATIAKAITQNELKQASAYFASLKPKPWVKVVEATMVPKTFVGSGNMRFALEKSPMEPLGQRIIELPQDPERAKSRDSHSGFIAYVPVGSLKKGADLVKTGGQRIVGGKVVMGNTVACATCHGMDMRGGVLPGVPGIGGRSAIYTYRQLNDFKNGVRKGLQSTLMQPTVMNLTPADMISISAYTAAQIP
jgi:cytochrome c553